MNAMTRVGWSRPVTAADLFRETWPTHTTKRVQAAASCPWETARNWVKRRFRPDADMLLKMVRESAELRAELVRVLGEWNAMDQVDGRAVVAPAGEAACQARGPGGPPAAPDPDGVAPASDEVEQRQEWC